LIDYYHKLLFNGSKKFLFHVKRVIPNSAVEVTISTERGVRLG